MNPITSVAILREVYCRLVVKNLEAQLLAAAPLLETGCFFSPYLNQFHATITFGVPGLADYVYSARLQIYVPTPRLGQWPGDVYVEYTAMSDGAGESGDPPTQITVCDRGPDPQHHRADLCRWLNERVLDTAREARLALQHLEPVEA